MPQTIISRVVSAVTDKRGAFATGQGRRPFDFLDDWLSIRIGAVISFNASATLTGSPRLKFGLNAGVVLGEGPGSSGTSHFLGMTTPENVTEWTYNAGSPPYLNCTNSAKSIKKIGAVITDISNALALKFSADPTVARNALFVEVVKGSPNFTIAFAGPTSAAAAQTDITPALFLQLFEAAALTDMNGIVSGYTTGGHQSVAIDEGTYGAFDCLALHWDKQSVACEVSAVGRRKLS
jgi:hypothetical protein